jgi:sugar phosphate permease
VLAGVPLSEAVAGFGWRAAMLASAAVTLVLALLVWLWVRDDPSERGYASHAHPEALNNAAMSPWRSLKLVISERDTWLLFFAGGLIAAPVLTFAGLWGVPYLVQVHGLERSHAAVFTTTMLLGFAVGGPLLGALSDRVGRRKLPYLGAALVHALGWMIFLLVDGLPATALYLLFGVIGFSAGGLIIGFAFAREVTHPGAAGTVGGVVNMAVLGFAALQQSAMGWILDRNWQGAMVEGARVYDAAAYHAAFQWLAVSAVGAVVFVSLTRETGCRLRFDSDD